MSPVTLIGLLCLLAIVARATRLVTRDTIAAPMRAATITRWGPQSWPAEWVACPWCVSLWAAAAAAPACALWADTAWLQTVAAAAAASWLYSIAAAWLDE